MKTATQSRSEKRQHGLSLIELLIALAISGFLILGITQIYIDNKRNYNFQQSQAGNQENQRFLVMLLDSYLNKAGYQRSPTQIAEDSFKKVDATTDCQAFNEASAVTPTASGIGICIRYYPLRSGELDCLGNSTPTFDDSKAYNEKGEPITMVLRYIAADDLNGTLQCKVGNQTADLITGMADFRLSFGMAQTSGGAINNTINFEDWSADKGTIVQVRYSALMASQKPIRSTDSQALIKWKQTASTTEKPRLEAGDKGQLFQTATNTVAMRNLTP